jgi:hypothetical protein
MRKVFAMSSLTPRIRGCRVAHWLPAVPLCVSHDMVMDQVSQSSRTSPFPSHLITVPKRDSAMGRMSGSSACRSYRTLAALQEARLALAPLLVKA